MTLFIINTAKDAKKIKESNSTRLQVLIFINIFAH